MPKDDVLRRDRLPAEAARTELELAAAYSLFEYDAGRALVILMGAMAIVAFLAAFVGQSDNPITLMWGVRWFPPLFLVAFLLTLRILFEVQEVTVSEVGKWIGVPVIFFWTVIIISSALLPFRLAIGLFAIAGTGQLASAIGSEYLAWLTAQPRISNERKERRRRFWKLRYAPSKLRSYARELLVEADVFQEQGQFAETEAIESVLKGLKPALKSWESQFSWALWYAVLWLLHVPGFVVCLVAVARLCWHFSLWTRNNSLHLLGLSLWPALVHWVMWGAWEDGGRGTVTPGVYRSLSGPRQTRLYHLLAVVSLIALMFLRGVDKWPVRGQAFGAMWNWIMLIHVMTALFLPLAILFDALLSVSGVLLATSYEALVPEDATEQQYD